MSTQTSLAAFSGLGARAMPGRESGGSSRTISGRDTSPRTTRASKPVAWMSASAGKAVIVSGLVALAAAGMLGPTSAMAGNSPRLPAHFSGSLSDYTPLAVNNVPIKGAPYEMHGTWTLDLNEARGKATFSAEIAMETSEVANPDPNFDPAKLSPHTHHIRVVDGVLHDGPMDWQTMCPSMPPTNGGFAVTGSAYLTGNGASMPFGNPTPVTICILGVSNPLTPNSAYVEFANFTLTIGAPASAHFGPQAIHGVVASCSGQWGHRRQDCSVRLAQ